MKKETSKISNLLINYRNTHMLTQNDLAKKIGITRATLSRLELNAPKAPSVKTIKALSKFFNISTNDLIGEEKIHKLQTLETTNMLIDGYIENCDITNKDDLTQNKDIYNTIIESLKLEINLKLRVKDEIKKS